jgi:putative peptide-modifying radical SAM enzyme
VSSELQYHILLTEKCNLSCNYCGGTRHIEGIPIDVAYTVDDLARFIAGDPEPIIGFYGGEPLLAIDMMYEVMDHIPAKAFTLQTNATHLAEVKTKYLKRLDAILVSVDGDKGTTDANRHTGCYDSVMVNCRDIQRRGYNGDLVARMAFSRKGDISRDVTHLLELVSPHFDHVHWQLDVFWSDLGEEEEVEEWLARYDEGVTRLVGYFGESLGRGTIPGIIPFIPILHTLITGESVPHIWCGSGRDSFAVMTSGRVDACPIAPELSYSRVGDIWHDTPGSIMDSVPVGEPCSLCPDKWICGGRCLFANKTMFWGRRWFDRICASTRHLIRELGSLTEPTKRLMKDGVLPRDALDYPAINNGCEIIP